MPKLSPEDSAKTIMELERMEDFEMERDQISRIEVKKPGLRRSGLIVIHPSEGEPVEISLRNQIAYHRLVQLTRAFDPKIVSS